MKLKAKHFYIFMGLFLLLAFFSVVSRGGITSSSVTLWVKEELFNFISSLLNIILMFFVIIQIQDNRSEMEITKEQIRMEKESSENSNKAVIKVFSSGLTVTIQNFGFQFAYDIQYKLFDMNSSDVWEQIEQGFVNYSISKNVLAKGESTEFNFARLNRMAKPILLEISYKDVSSKERYSCKFELSHNQLNKNVQVIEL